MRKLSIEAYPESYVVCRLAADAEPPAGVFAAAGLVSVTRTEDELSIVCPESVAPAGAQLTAGGWRRLTVHGPLEFSLTGIMAALSGALAEAGVSLFAVSTYDTDHILVKQSDLGRALEVLRTAGHEVTERNDAG
ncbi:ACT domain-containing protein [Sciscionella marina]|uniref:ACT domain-containing protein n=1 Tax=Sciscionella marina TaxID=508770 RepID=UPI000371AAC1|nr:ACT domain-containing protein [Sciscionella marina]